MNRQGTRTCGTTTFTSSLGGRATCSTRPTALLRLSTSCAAEQPSCAPHGPVEALRYEPCGPKTSQRLAFGPVDAGGQGSIVELHEAPQTSAFSALGSLGSEQLAFGFPLPAGTR